MGCASRLPHRTTRRLETIAALRSLSGLQDALPEEDKQEIYYRLGQYTRQLNHIRGERFGYYGQPDRQTGRKLV